MLEIKEGPPIAAICETVFLYTEANPEAPISLDMREFASASIPTVLQLIRDLPTVERFVHPDYAGTLKVTNCGWGMATAVRAVFNTVIYRAAPKSAIVIS